MAPDVYRRNDDKLLQRLEKEKRRVQDLTAQIEALPDLDAQRADLEKLVQHYPGVIQNQDPAAIATALQNVGIKLLIENGQVITVVCSD